MATQPAVWGGKNSTPLTPRHLRLAPRRLRAQPNATGLRAPGWSRGACRAEGAAVREAPACATRPHREDLLVSLYPLVRRMALKMRSHLPASVEVDDLVGAGALGLLDAVDKFDPSKHTKLETYARHRIRGSMLDSLRALDPVSRSMRVKSRKIEELYRELGNRLGRAASDEEMAEALGVDLQEWQHILGKLQSVAKEGDFSARWPARMGAGVRHLTHTGGEDSDAVADLPSGGDGPFELLLRREQREILQRALATLPARDREVMILYYWNELTMAQIAASLGVDESRICQIHSQVLARLWRHVQSRMGDLCPARVIQPLPVGVRQVTGGGVNPPLRPESVVRYDAPLHRVQSNGPGTTDGGQGCDLPPATCSGSLRAIGSLIH